MTNSAEVKHIADLAKLEISDEEINSYKKNLDEILEFVEIINNIDVSNIELTINSNELVNKFRKDEIIQFNNTENLLKSAPSEQENMFRIPKVIN